MPNLVLKALLRNIGCERRCDSASDSGSGLKKARLSYDDGFLHASYPQQPPDHIDRLQQLYSHPRDADIRMDEKAHTYYVFGEPYSLSVSGWWKKFFGDFDAKTMSACIVDRHRREPGFRMLSGEVPAGVLASSVYNFYQRVRILDRQGDEQFLIALRSVALAAEVEYSSRGVCLPFSVDSIVECGRRCLADLRKPEGVTCYYLVLLRSVALTRELQADEIARTWELNGKLESLKGTFLHKKIELFINAMARPMQRDGTLDIPVGVLLAEPVAPYEYSFGVVLDHLAWAQEPTLWDHPLAQRFFAEERTCESIEFSKFRKWLSTKLRWSPYRVEWSLYNEDLKVAGQIDSLWKDLDNAGDIVMVDWKRTRELLTDDESELARRSFGRMGVSYCSHLYDVPWSHYFVQQTLYSYLLEANYGLTVKRVKLVQCHPHVCGSEFYEAPLEADVALAANLARCLRSSVMD